MIEKHIGPPPKLNQRQFALRSGLTPSTLQRWRNDPEEARKASQDSVARVARFTGVPLAELWAGDIRPGLDPRVSHETLAGRATHPGGIPDAFWALEKMALALADISRQAGELTRAHAAE